MTQMFDGFIEQRENPLKAVTAAQGTHNNNTEVVLQSLDSLYVPAVGDFINYLMNNISHAPNESSCR